MNVIVVKVTHTRIKSFFKESAVVWFTGTPIFADNNVGEVTSADVFRVSTKYIITNAI